MRLLVMAFLIAEDAELGRQDLHRSSDAGRRRRPAQVTHMLAKTYALLTAAAMAAFVFVPTASAEPILSENVCPPAPLRPTWHELFDAACIVCGDDGASCLIYHGVDCRIGISRGSCVEKVTSLFGDVRCDWDAHHVHCWNAFGDLFDSRWFCSSFLRACDFT